MFRYGLQQIFCTIIFALLLVSCSKNEPSDLPIVSVGNEVLTRSALLSVIPYAASAEDSSVYADDFVRSWVRRQVMLRRAEKNLSSEIESIDKAVEEYRASLLIETYQMRMVDQKFNPKISRGEIENYYSEMKENFILRDHIVKGVYAVIPTEASDLPSFVKLLSSFKDESSINIEQYLYKYSSNYKLFTDNWQQLSSIRKFFPANSISDDLRVLRSNKLIDVTYEGNRYLLKITDIQQSGTIAPLEAVSQDIYNVLLGKKKLEFLSSLSDGLYDEAVREGSIIYYEQSN